MPKILLIETATSVCSVCLVEDKEVLSKRESFIDRTHAKLLAPFIKELMEETELQVSDLDAIAVSMGPGSYTGLRIGVSMAKGLCYGSNLPLIAVPTLEAMVYGFSEQNKLQNDSAFLCPMIDARRMEVYTSIFDCNLNEVQETLALVVEKDSFNNFLNKGKCYLFGSGAQKLKEELNHNNLFFGGDFIHSSANMIIPAFKKYKEKSFEDVAYFEPYYLKEFIATTPKKRFF